MNKSGCKQVYTNKLFHKITYIYGAILLIMALFVCYMAYTKERNTMVNQLDQCMVDLNYEYESVREDFWRLYMPFWSNKDRVYTIMETYFNENTNGELSPIERKDMVEALQILMSSDDRMKWIGIFRGADANNYLLLQNGTSLITLNEEFPFYTHLVNKKRGMEVFESQLIEIGNFKAQCFALCGGTALSMGEGKIIMGYESGTLLSQSRQSKLSVDADYYIVNEFGILFDSTGKYDSDWLEYNSFECGIARNSPGKQVYIRELEKDSKSYRVFSVVPWWDMFLKSNNFTPYILLMVIIFWLLSLLMYRGAGNVILKKIHAIQFGLSKIANNDLDYRIPVPEVPNDEFEIISGSINDVTGRLQDNIHKAYLSKLRQKESELSELQAKFDPHFLYNTLEVIRGKVYENGDDETANIIVKLVAIFRSFIGSDNFISIREEMEFCSLYLSLLKYRYDNEVRIIYDIDSSILEYGIIRNLLQPLLENYFVHGFSKHKKDNQLSIRGKLWDDDYICFVIKDNGLGITNERLDILQNNLDEVETGTRHGYGLKSVNRRAKLFYGPECGLEIDRNENGGVTIRILIRKLTCEEHKEKLSMEDEYSICSPEES